MSDKNKRSEEQAMKTSELLPCPFCGGKAELQKGLCELDNYVMCLDCRSKTKLYNTKEGAINAWNTRKPIEAIVERLNTEKGTYIDENGKELFQEDYFIDIDEAIEIVKEVGA